MWRCLVVISLIHLDMCYSASFLPCRSNWTKVLQTDSKGKEETGNKKVLIDAILHGAQLQVFVPDWGYASSTQLITTLKNNSELCAEAIFHISKDSWESFHSDAYWYFIALCTTGIIEKARWYVGTHVQPSSLDTSALTTSRLRIMWFVRYDHGKGTLETDPVYCNSRDGHKTCGSLDNLAAAVKTGSEIRASYDLVGSNLVSPFNHVTISKNNGLVSGQTIWSVSAEISRNDFAFIQNAFWNFYIFSTSGMVEMSGWNIGSHDNRGNFSIKASINWFADTCWMLAYTHDEMGNTLDGSLSFLRSAILSGHKIKLVIGNYSIEADNIVVNNNGSISAQLLGHVAEKSAEHFDQNGYWYWKHVSTSGEAETIQYDIGSSTKEGSVNYTTSASWYIDSTHWKHVLSTSKLGFTTFGSKTDLISDIRKGSTLRCVIKFSQNHILVAQADNVEISPDGTNLGAQILRIVSYTTEETPSRHFENVPYWKFTIVTTKGKVQQSDWVVGDHVTRQTNPMTADIDWFVN